MNRGQLGSRYVVAGMAIKLADFPDGGAAMADWNGTARRLSHNLARVVQENSLRSARWGLRHRSAMLARRRCSTRHRFAEEKIPAPHPQRRKTPGASFFSEPVALVTSAGATTAQI